MLRNVFLAVLLLMVPNFAWGDGKVFAHRTAIAEPTIPDQRALIFWSNGTERLVIETRFVGPGTNFAWVVPLPAKPIIEEATSGLFETLAFQLRPKVVHDYEPLSPLFGLCLALGYLLLFVRRDREASPWDIVACGLAALGLVLFSPVAGAITFLLLLWIVSRVRSGRSAVVSLFLFFVTVLFLSSLLMPALGVRSRSLPTSGVEELQHSRVGAFDTTTIASTNGTALMAWLRDNEFALPTNAIPILADYAKRGWVFVAARLHAAAEQAGTNSIHPLSFTFPAKEAVYPLRLTGVGASTLEVELFVFGLERTSASASGFRMRRCSEVKFERNPSKPWQEPEVFAAMHPNLRNWASGLSTVTKLTGTLTPADMQSDATIHWSSFKPVKTTLYSWRGAASTALDWSLGLLLAVSFVVAIAMVIRPEWQRSGGKVAAYLSAGTLFLFAGICLSLPKTAIRESRSYFPRITLIEVQTMGQLTVAEWSNNPPATLDEARKVALAHRPTRGNFILGGSVREQDSPGNYVIRQSTNGFQFVWFDSQGAEHPIEQP